MPTDLEVIEEFHQQYGSDILKLVRFYTRNRDEAEDLVQEVFIKAFRSLSSFRNNCAPRTWLMRIAINSCRNHARWKRRHPMLTLDTVPDVSSPGDNPESILLNEIQRHELLNAVFLLPSKLKECILLHYFDEQSVAQISETLMVSQSAVKQRLARGRKRIAEVLGGDKIERGRTRPTTQAFKAHR